VNYISSCEKVCKKSSQWLLSKGCRKIWRRLRESSPSIMTMFSKKIMNSISNIVLLQVKFNAFTMEEKNVNMC
jgi:hypothetical protein